jgi:hypothetical protein
MLHNPCLLKKVNFLAFKTLLSPFGTRQKSFLSTFNVIILQMVRNERVRFSGHVHIEISYKILQLEILNEAPNLFNSPYFW